MTLLALRPELQPVAIVLATRPMTVGALRRRPLVDTFEVTRFALNREVATLERKGCLIVKLPVRSLELGLRRCG